MCLTSHFIDDDWTYHRRIINFKPISSHKGEDIGRDLLESLNDWDIENVMTVTVDNASANKVALDYLKEILPNLILRGEYLHMRCMAHIINLVVKDGLKEFVTSIERVRSAVRYVRASPARTDTFKKCVKEKEIQSQRLLQLDCPTRWNSTFDMLHVAEKFETAFTLFEIKDRGFKHELGEDVPRITDRFYIRTFASVLQIFKTKTEKVPASSYVVANQFFMELMDLDVHIRKLCKDNDLTVRLMAGNMRCKFNKYYGGVKQLNMLMYFATVLDPRMKMQIIRFGFRKICKLERKAEKERSKELGEDLEKKLEEILEEDPVKAREKALEKQKALSERRVEDLAGVVDKALSKIFKEYKSMYEKDSSNVSSKTYGDNDNVSCSDNAFLDVFLMEGGSILDTKTELDRYIDETCEPNTQRFDILLWWKVNSLRFPILSKLARDILAFPISTVASESAFSTGGRVLDETRSFLSPSIVEALVCTQDWIRKARKGVTMEDDLDELDTIAKDICEKFKEKNAPDEATVGDTSL